MTNLTTATNSIYVFDRLLAICKNDLAKMVLDSAVWYLCTLWGISPDHWVPQHSVDKLYESLEASQGT